MRSFLVGNTEARSLVPANDTSSRLLWLASGDVRNFLTTLTNLSEIGGSLEVVLNDASGLVAARNAAMLLLAARPEDEMHAIALWCDAFLDDRARSSVERALRSVSEGDLPAWLSVAPEARRVASRWLSLVISPEETMEKRRRRISGGKGHGRCGSSPEWRERGTVMTTTGKHPNPSMFDVDAPGIPFVEDTGPSGAFRGLGGLRGGALTKALRDAWRPLFDALRRKISNLSITISVEDCCSRRPNFHGSFDAVDSSNASDYVGLFNLLVSCPPTRFLRTEHVLTVASGVDAVLAEEFPFDSKGSRRALRAAGWTPALVPKDSTAECVVRIDWRRCPKLAMKRADARTLLSQLFERSMPLPMNADMLEEETRPVELSYAWPKVTCATIVEFALECRRQDMRGALDAILECRDLVEAPLVRNHVLSIEIEIARRKRRCKNLAPRAILNRSLPKLKSVKVPLPKNLFVPRSGLFEPSLAVALIADAGALSNFAQNQGWVKEKNDDGEEQVFNAAFEWFQNADVYTAQLVDRVHLAPFATSLKVRLPAAEDATKKKKSEGKHAYFAERSIIDYFEFLVLVDVQTYAILGTPHRLADLIGK